MHKIRGSYFLIWVLMLCCQSIYTQMPKASEPPLKTQELRELVTGNTFIGNCKDTSRRFALYFAPGGKVYIQKAGTPYTFYGNWTVSDGMLNTPWPYEDLQVHKQNILAFYQRRDLRKYHLEFREVSPDHFQPFKVRSCSCDPSPEFAFPVCEWFQGHVPL